MALELVLGMLLGRGLVSPAPPDQRPGQDRADRDEGDQNPGRVGERRSEGAVCIAGVGLELIVLTTDDVQAAYEELQGKGVEFTEAPMEQPYGMDSEFRDPSGNKFRLGKPTV